MENAEDAAREALNLLRAKIDESEAIAARLWAALQEFDSLAKRLADARLALERALTALERMLPSDSATNEAPHAHFTRGLGSNTGL